MSERDELFEPGGGAMLLLSRVLIEALDHQQIFYNAMHLEIQWKHKK